MDWPYRLTVRTSPFQGGNQSSILCRVTATKLSTLYECLFCAVTLSKQTTLLASENRKTKL